MKKFTLITLFTLFINLIAGSDVTFFIDGCTGFPASLTIVDSTGAAGGLGTVIPGAYVAAACPNNLNFIAPYTGRYNLVFDADGNCSNFGSTAIGIAAIKLNNAASITNCTPFPAPVNDSICNAIPVTLGTIYSGNSTYASATDERDADVVNGGFACSAPNNTLWYSFTPAASGDFEFVSDAPLVGGAEGEVEHEGVALRRRKGDRQRVDADDLVEQGLRLLQRFKG